MGNNVRKGFKFNCEDAKQRAAVEILGKLGHKQAEFIAELISDFIARGNFDPYKISKKELEAIILLSKAGIRKVEGATQPPQQVSKAEEANNSSNNEQAKTAVIDDDTVDEGMLSQMNLFN